jgi:hypothetical protein
MRAIAEHFAPVCAKAGIDEAELAKLLGRQHYPMLVARITMELRQWPKRRQLRSRPAPPLSTADDSIAGFNIPIRVRKALSIEAHLSEKEHGRELWLTRIR